MSETRIDPHVKILDEQVIERAKSRGLDVLVYAPHFTRLPAARRRAERLSDEDLLVVPAREIFTGPWQHRKHVLALGLDEPVPDFITLEGAMRELDRQDAVVLAPHPEFLTVSLDRGDLRAYESQIDALEVYNPKHLEQHNERAVEMAKTLDMPEFGSSYAHRKQTIGEVWTAISGDIDSEAALLEAFREGRDRRVERRNGSRHDWRCRAEFAHLAWENTWKKFDRLLLSGTEPTHPDHVAYDGRFDDVAVY
ncbi:MAG: PHP-associated domain-containing protein [Halobacteriota archaeon]